VALRRTRRPTTLLESTRVRLKIGMCAKTKDHAASWRGSRRSVAPHSATRHLFFFPQRFVNWILNDTGLVAWKEVLNTQHEVYSGSIFSALVPNALMNSERLCCVMDHPSRLRRTRFAMTAPRRTLVAPFRMPPRASPHRSLAGLSPASHLRSIVSPNYRERSVHARGRLPCGPVSEQVPPPEKSNQHGQHPHPYHTAAYHEAMVSFPLRFGCAWDIGREARKQPLRPYAAIESRLNALAIACSLTRAAGINPARPASVQTRRPRLLRSSPSIVDSPRTFICYHALHVRFPCQGRSRGHVRLWCARRAVGPGR
jgi:hypothetical protein